MKPFRKVTAVFDLQAVHPIMPTHVDTSSESVPMLLAAVAQSTSAQKRLPQPHRKHMKYDLCADRGANQQDVHPRKPKHAATSRGSVSGMRDAVAQPTSVQ